MSRHLYANTLAGFLADHREGRIVGALRDRYVKLFGHAAERAEVDAWKNSLPALANVLGADAFAGAEIFVELFMPLDNRRCDALLTGRTAAKVDWRSWSSSSSGRRSRLRI